MLKMKFWITFFLSLLLIACGGGGDPLTSSEDDTTDENDDGAPVETSVGNPQIGTGTGADYEDNSLDIIITSLSAGGSTRITADIVDAADNNSRVITAEYYVIFSSTCASTGQAEFSKDDDFVSTGSVSVTYTATGCSGTDQITFTLYDSTDGEADTSQVLDTAVGTLEVAPPQIGAINFTGSDTPAISIKTIGNPVLPKLAVLTFTVVDKNNNPVPNRTVNFELTNTKGGVELSLDDGVTDENGQVQAVVLSGTTHVITTVIATTLSTDEISLISTSSQPISVTTGIADQDSFDIAVDVFNPNAYSTNGTSVNVTVYAADQFQNPVPDETIINFNAESGSIGSFCQTTAGSCSVVWSSSGDRPGEADPDLERVNEENALNPGETVVGMTTILAYTQGEGGFTDSNNNGVFDIDEPYVTLDEPIRDDNWNSELDELGNDNGSESSSVEFFADYNDNNKHDKTSSETKYQGALCSEEAKENGHCENLTYVSGLVRIVQSAGRSGITFRYFVENTDEDSDRDRYEEITDDGFTYTNYVYVVVQDVNGNIPANSSSASFGAEGYEVSGGSGAVPNSIGYLNEEGTPLPDGFPVNRGALYTVSFDRDPDADEYGPLESSMTFEELTSSSSLGIRSRSPTLDILYRPNNGDQDGDGSARDLGETFDTYDDQDLDSGELLWAVITDETGADPDDSVVYRNKVTSGDATASEITAREPNDLENFPVDTFGNNADVYEFSLTKGEDGSSVFESKVLYKGGSGTRSTTIYFN